MATVRRHAVTVLAVVLVLYTLLQLNSTVAVGDFRVELPEFTPAAQTVVFAGLGLALCFLMYPVAEGVRDKPLFVAGDLLLASATLLAYGYLAVQNEPAFQALWTGDTVLSNRFGMESRADLVVAGLALALLLEATRRCIGWVLLGLGVVFILHSFYGRSMPDWAFPHAGASADRILSQLVIQDNTGIFGIALQVMFKYVFIFVIFGALLETTGVGQWVIDTSRRLFAGTTGGAAKVAVFSSGLTGSLSGSAVANTATTGTITIPLMRSSGFSPTVAGGVEAAASSGGALVPPVMGAGAFLMLERMSQDGYAISYGDICKAAILPAALYYLSLFLIVHLFAKKLGSAAAGDEADDLMPVLAYEAVVFLAAFGVLIGFLWAGFTVFRAASVTILAVFALSMLHPRTRLNGTGLVDMFRKCAVGGVPLVTAAAAVGIVIGAVGLSDLGTQLSTQIIALGQDSKLLALFLVMVSSLILGMGLPSAICYLLLAQYVGTTFADFGVQPLAGHFFIFYFGLMSMVTPPVALAAYAASSIAGSPVMRTAFAAFRFALVGFTLPYIFVYRPELLLVSSRPDVSSAPWLDVGVAVFVAVCGIVPLAAAIVGYLLRPLVLWERSLLIVAAALALFPSRLYVSDAVQVAYSDLAGIALLAGVLVWQWRTPGAANASTGDGPRTAAAAP